MRALVLSLSSLVALYRERSSPQLFLIRLFARNLPLVDVFHGKQVSWHSSVYNATDQLRQRVAWALAQILVISEEGISTSDMSIERWANYYDILVRNALGNYRDLLREVRSGMIMRCINALSLNH